MKYRDQLINAGTRLLEANGVDIVAPLVGEEDFAHVVDGTLASLVALPAPALTDVDFESFSEPIMRHFAFAHLPPALQAVSSQFARLAIAMMDLPRGAERAAGLRKLLEAKDCAVRAARE